MKIQDAINLARQTLSPFSNSFQLDAELLVALALSCSRTFLYTYPEKNLTNQQQQNFNHFLDRRLKGEPIAYILGYQEFWSLCFKVTSHTLIPRPETEHLVEWILESFSNEEAISLAELGTGTGAIAISLASERNTWKIDATDISDKALKIANENAKKHQQLVHFYQGSWCQALPHDQYDIIVSNPPYLAQNDPHLTELNHEPCQALVAGPNGLEAIEHIVDQSPNYLKKGGFLIIEHGYNQGEAVKKLLTTHHFINVQGHKDLADLFRFTTAQKDF